ncbi:MAG: hypothetical protein ABIK28_01075 [Planctomycetota bacterium]
MKSAFLLPITVLLSIWTAACTTPPMAPDFTTPAKTLRTFHNAFIHDDAGLEYECLSRDFKKENGNISLSRYHDFRVEFKAQHPMLQFFSGLVDIEESIQEQQISPDGRLAVLKLDLVGEEFVVVFIRENTYRIEYDSPSARPEEGLIDPMEKIISARGNEMELTLPLTKKTRKRLQEIKRIEVKEQWKFREFSSLSENSSVST